MIHRLHRLMEIMLPAQSWGIKKRENKKRNEWIRFFGWVVNFSTETSGFVNWADIFWELSTDYTD
jgi:hypothetical protein